MTDENGERTKGRGGYSDATLGLQEAERATSRTNSESNMHVRHNAISTSDLRRKRDA